MQYFTIKELTHSQTATVRGIDNSPSLYAVMNLTALVVNVLDPARAALERPIYVGSGFRCPELNRLVGGDANSQHLRGEAADIHLDSPRENYELGCLLVRLGNFDQVIFENVGKNDLLPDWVHVSWKRTGTNRHEIRKHVKGTGPIYPFVDKRLLNL